MFIIRDDMEDIDEDGVGFDHFKFTIRSLPIISKKCNLSRHRTDVLEREGRHFVDAHSRALVGCRHGHSAHQ